MKFSVYVWFCVGGFVNIRFLPCLFGIGVITMDIYIPFSLANLHTD